MKVCKQCGQSVQDVETYCPRCGSGQLVTDGVQRTQQRPQPQQQQSVQGGNNQPRQPQQAPPGYRNPNAVTQQRPQGQPQQRPQGQGQPNMSGQGQPQQRPPQRPQGQPMQGQPMQRPQQRPQQPQQQFNEQPQYSEQDEYGFGAEQLVQKKKLFGKDKAPKAPKHPKAPKQPKQPVQNMRQDNMGYGVQVGYGSGSDETVTMKEWAVMILKMMIPIYNIIFIISVWRGKNVKPSMQNYVKVTVIMMVACMIITLLLSVLLGSVIAGIIANMSY